MDPQSLVFTPQNDYSRLSNMMRSVQEIQQEHADRLARLERRHDEDTKVKSVWGPSSPFPGVIGGGLSSQQAQNNSSSDFAGFDDDHSTSMVRSLQLDADDEPRRLGATSRTNSVRFDESANQSGWSHGPRSSIDLFQRTASNLSGLGGHPLFERSTSHRSEGRYGSTAQSVASRANSLALDAHSRTQSPMEPPGLAPGLFILGSVPAIIRCWLNSNFKHDSLLYAAICTGSYRSFLDLRLIKELKLEDQIARDISGKRRIKLAMYLPEATIRTSSSRSNSPVPQIPSLTVDFTVIETEGDFSPKSVQIIIGSDVLRSHSADILLSSNSVKILDDDHNPMSIPLVRPESDETFKTLATTNHLPTNIPMRYEPKEAPSQSRKSSTASMPLNVNGLSEPTVAVGNDVSTTVDSNASQRADDESGTASSDTGPEGSQRPLSRGASMTVDTGSSALSTEMAEPSSSAISSHKAPASPAIWSNWRRDGGAAPPQSDWANASKNSGTYSRPNREQGIKVLRPSRQISRSSTTPLIPSPSSSHSRFFDDGRRRAGAPVESETNDLEQVRSPVVVETSSNKGAGSKESSKSRAANPLGGGTAFGWLNSSQQK